MNVNQLIAVSDADKAIAGAIVWWKLAGNVSYENLCLDWIGRGLPEDMLPNATSPQMAAKRAAESKRLITSEFVEPARGGYAILERRDLDGRVRYDEIAHVQAVASSTVENDVVLAVEPPDFAWAEQLRRAYALARRELEPGQVGSWLSWLAQKLGATSLRPGGGVYFFLPEAAERWRSMVAMLQKNSGHVVYEVPAMRSQDAVRAVLDAVTTEAVQEMAAIRQDLEGEMGARALEGRRGRLEAMADKVRCYEDGLGGRLDGLREQLEQLDGIVAAAALAAQQETAS